MGLGVEGLGFGAWSWGLGVWSWGLGSGLWGLGNWGFYFEPTFAVPYTRDSKGEWRQEIIEKLELYWKEGSQDLLDQAYVIGQAMFGKVMEANQKTSEGM